MDLPQVSIIIPNFNRATLIAETLDSIKGQTYTSWEVVIVDDGSTDRGEQVIQDFIKTDTRFTYIKRNRLPKGAPTCRNIGVNNAKGDYIIFLDSDDLLAPFCLEQRVTYMQEHSNLDFAVFPGQLFNSKIGDNDLLINIPTKESDLERFLKQDTPWLICNPIWKRSVLQQHPWHENLLCFQDYLFHITALLKNYTYQYVIAPPDCFWRRGDHEAISKTNQSLDRIVSIKEVVDDIRELLVQQKLFAKYNKNIQSSYVDVMHRSLNSENICFAKQLLKNLSKEKIFTKTQEFYLDLYIKAYPLLKSSIWKKVVKRLIRFLIGSSIFEKQYGTFIRIKAQDFFKNPIGFSE